MTFNAIAQRLLDNWLRQPAPSPSDVYGDVLEKLSIRARICVVDVRAADWRDWMLRPVKGSGVVSRIIDLNAVFRHGPLGAIEDADYLKTSVLPQYRRIIGSGQPAIDKVNTRLLGLRVIYDRIVLPEKSSANPAWLVTCTWGRFMSPLPKHDLVVDDVDQAIYLHLFNGSSAKEIAIALDLSNRTIEHRIERLKKMTGARNTAGLVALITTAGLDGSIRFSVDG